MNSSTSAFVSAGITGRVTPYLAGECGNFVAHFLDLLYVHACFVYMYVCAPYVCLVPEESERGTGEFQMLRSYHVGAGS